MYSSLLQMSFQHVVGLPLVTPAVNAPGFASMFSISGYGQVPNLAWPPEARITTAFWSQAVSDVTQNGKFPLLLCVTGDKLLRQLPFQSTHTQVARARGPTLSKFRESQAGAAATTPWSCYCAALKSCWATGATTDFRS